MCLSFIQIHHSSIHDAPKSELLGGSYLIERKSEEFVEKVYMSEIEGPRKRGMPVVRWKDGKEVHA